MGRAELRAGNYVAADEWLTKVFNYDRDGKKKIGGAALCYRGIVRHRLSQYDAAHADFELASELIGNVPPRGHLSVDAADYNQVALWLAWYEAATILAQD